MKDSLLKYRNSTVSYSCFGNGRKVIFCFHGYGEDNKAWRFLEKYAGGDFTFYSIDLPFHGKTEWNEGLNFTQHDLLAIVKEIILVSGKPVTDNQQISLAGFSLGGRMALSLYQAIPGQVAKLVLIAPDGLKVNFWYWLATQTWAGNRFFAFTMKRPGWFLGILRLMNTLGLVNASIFKFVTHYIGNPGVRKLLYMRWTAFRKLKPDLKKIKSQIQENHTPVRLVYGKHDRIILSSVGEKFRKGNEEDCRISIIPSGHQVLHEKHAEHIMENLLG